MYPAQTSFIPTQVALVRFLESQGWQAIFTNYPYWYLGSAPFRYFTGPILPIFSSSLHSIFPSVSLFTIFFWLVGIVWVIGGIGVYLLVKELSGRKQTAILAALFYVFGPIVPFLFRFSGGVDLIAFSFLPYVLLLYTKFLRREKPRKILTSSESRGRREIGREKRKSRVLLCLLIAFVILIDSEVLPSLILGMVAIFLATTGWKKAEEKLTQTFLIFAFSFLISSLWYTPGYWWQLLIAPSFAGKPLFKVVGQLSQLLPISLAIGLAIISGKLIKLKGQVLRFCFYWLFLFGFLTLIRFISDPDFWLDWMTYCLELQFGLAVLAGLVLGRQAKWIIYFVVCCLLFVVWVFVTNRYVIGTLQKDVTQTVEYKIGSQLAKVAKPEEKVFLSGTTVFWFNAFFDLSQVRGGKDEVSVNQDWRKAAWEIREGGKVEKSVEWLKELGVSWLVVHTKDSKEFWHDFAYPEKFEGVSDLRKVYDQEGDRIYKVED